MKHIVLGSALALLALLSNAWSTGDHPWRALDQGLWAVAGVDLTLLACSVVACSLGWHFTTSTGMVAGRNKQ